MSKMYEIDTVVYEPKELEKMMKNDFNKCFQTKP